MPHAMMIRFAPALVLLLAFAADLGAQAPQEIRLWPGKAPGSESWSIPESTTTSPSGDRTISNVSDPSVTVYLPDAALANGAAVVVAPGGALRLLGWDNEGVKVAQWLNTKGIAAVVLKYRTLQAAPGGGRGRGGPAGGGAPPAGAPRAGGPGRGAAPRQELEIKNGNANPEPNDAGLAEVLRMATADAQQALRLVRRNATAWRIDPVRVGIMGFSAGGGVAVGTALAPQTDASPDFLVSLYGPSLQDVNVPAHAPPLFIAVGSTHFNVTNGCLALFAQWKAAGKPAEIHVYDGVSGGFGMSTRGLPVDSWRDRFHDWLVARKIVPVTQASGR
jgi:acetyl esterase/lipase